MAIRNKADRAKLFIPFDALKGFHEALKEKERILVSKKDLSQEEIEEISKTLQLIKKRDVVNAIYFDKNEYVEIIGMVSNIDFVYKTLKIIKTEIKFDDLLSIKVIQND